MNKKLLLFPNILKFVHDLGSADKALSSCEVRSRKVLDTNGFSNCMLLDDLIYRLRMLENIRSKIIRPCCIVWCFMGDFN